MKKKLRIYRMQSKAAVNVDDENLKIMKSIFNEDQMKRRSTKFMQWSNATVNKSLKIKFACGNNGYEELLNQKFPLPSLRTLRRRLEKLKFQSGILIEVFDFLKFKVEIFKDDHEKDCGIILDEMSITPSIVYDTSTMTYVSNVTLPGHSGVAAHALVIMLADISSRWKQTVAYYYTGSSTNGSAYKDILFEVIQRAENLGLRICNITSDMGPSNMELWREWKIVAGRFSEIHNFIIHPCYNKRKIYLLADVPHLFKNIKNMLVNNKLIYLTEEMQKKYDLPTNEINVDHIGDLIKYQENLNFLLAPKLTQQDLHPDHFDKMKISKSTHVISHDVTSALRFIAEELKKPEYLTTAWFISFIETWFNLMTSRHPSTALSKISIEKYNETITVLNDFITAMTEMYVGEKKSWKPAQTGALVSTKSIFDLQHHFLNEKDYVYLLTSRFTQDCFL